MIQVKALAVVMCCVLGLLLLPRLEQGKIEELRLLKTFVGLWKSFSSLFQRFNDFFFAKRDVFVNGNMGSMCVVLVREPGIIKAVANCQILIEVFNF